MWFDWDYYYYNNNYYYYYYWDYHWDYRWDYHTGTTLHWDYHTGTTTITVHELCWFESGSTVTERWSILRHYGWPSPLPDDE